MQADIEFEAYRFVFDDQPHKLTMGNKTNSENHQPGACLAVGESSQQTTHSTSSSTENTELGTKPDVTDSRYSSVNTSTTLRRSTRRCPNMRYTDFEVQQAMATANFEKYSKMFKVQTSQIAKKGLFARRAVPAGYEIDYYGEYFASMDDLRAAGHGDSAYVMGNYKCTGRDDEGRKIYTGVVVNGIAIPQQFAIYANHQPSTCANAKFHWDDERYLGRCATGQPVLIITRSLRPGEEITADYGPLFDYDRHNFRREDCHTDHEECH